MKEEILHEFWKESSGERVKKAYNLAKKHVLYNLHMQNLIGEWGSNNFQCTFKAVDGNGWIGFSHNLNRTLIYGDYETICIEHKEWGWIKGILHSSPSYIASKVEDRSERWTELDEEGVAEEIVDTVKYCLETEGTEYNSIEEAQKAINNFKVKVSCTVAEGVVFNIKHHPNEECESPYYTIEVDGSNVSWCSDYGNSEHAKTEAYEMLSELQNGLGGDGWVENIPTRTNDRLYFLIAVVGWIADAHDQMMSDQEWEQRKEADNDIWKIHRECSDAVREEQERSGERFLWDKVRPPFDVRKQAIRDEVDGIWLAKRPILREVLV